MKRTDISVTDETEMPMIEPADPELGQRLHDILLDVVEMEERHPARHTR